MSLGFFQNPGIDSASLLAGFIAGQKGQMVDGRKVDPLLKDAIGFLELIMTILSVMHSVKTFGASGLFSTAIGLMMGNLVGELFPAPDTRIPQENESTKPRM